MTKVRVEAHHLLRQPAALTWSAGWGECEEDVHLGCTRPPLPTCCLPGMWAGLGWANKKIGWMT